MARIRTIKPDFWTDEKLVECSMSARMLFIGTWNFADDNGNLQRSAKKLKMQIFPADMIDCEPLVQELLCVGALIEYSVNGEMFLHIKGFTKHQVINRPSKTNIPQPPFIDTSLSTHGVLTDGREEEGKGREEEEEEDKNTNTVVLVAASGAEPPGLFPDEAQNPASQCPHQQIVALYHEVLPASPAIRDWTPARAQVLRVRWKEDKSRQSLDWWKRFFEYIAESKFLTGRASAPGKKPFAPGLEWICKAENFAKIREGRYHEDAA